MPQIVETTVLLPMDTVMQMSTACSAGQGEISTMSGSQAQL